MKQPLRVPGQALIAAMVTFALPAWGQHEPGAHVHGRAALSIAIDGATVQVNLISPLDNLLKFERAPRNEKERQAVQAMALKLNEADRLFVFTTAAQCRVASIDLASPVLSPDLLMPASGSVKDTGKNRGAFEAAPSMPPASADAHAELDATWHFKCARPQSLQGADIRLFQVFPGLRRLDAAVAGPKGQSSTKLSPESTRLKW